MSNQEKINKINELKTKIQYLENQITPETCDVEWCNQKFDENYKKEHKIYNVRQISFSYRFICFMCFYQLFYK